MPLFPNTQMKVKGAGPLLIYLFAPEMSNYFVCIHRPVWLSWAHYFLRLDNIKEFRLKKKFKKPDCLLRVEFPRSHVTWGLPPLPLISGIWASAESLTKGHAIESKVSSNTYWLPVAEYHHLLGRHVGSGTRDMGSNSDFYLSSSFWKASRWGW